jgi:hypothetical protein
LVREKYRMRFWVNAIPEKHAADNPTILGGWSAIRKLAVGLNIGE